jgi:hypothetical protein
MDSYNHFLLEVIMASAFQEFSDTFEEFKRHFPRHPLIEELLGRISRSKYPDEQWLKIHTRKMKDLMAPVWLRQH